MKNRSFTCAQTFIRRAFVSLTFGIIFVLLFGVIAAAQIADTAPPEIVEFGFTPGEVDLSNDSQVVVTVRAKDAQSGVQTIRVNFKAPSAFDVLYGIFLTDSHRISGDEKDGVYRGVFSFRYRDERGKYKLDVSASDKNSNYAALYSGQLAERGFPSELNVIITEREGIFNFSGRILDANGRGVPNAVVLITGHNYRQYTSRTNAFGFYRFRQIVAPSQIGFEIRRKNFQTLSRAVYIDAARDNWNFTLQR